MQMGDLVELKSAWWKQMGVVHSGLIGMWYVPRIAGERNERSAEWVPAPGSRVYLDLVVLAEVPATRTMGD